MLFYLCEAQNKQNQTTCLGMHTSVTLLFKSKKIISMEVRIGAVFMREEKPCDSKDAYELRGGECW